VLDEHFAAAAIQFTCVKKVILPKISVGTFQKALVIMQLWDEMFWNKTRQWSKLGPEINM